MTPEVLLSSESGASSADASAELSAVADVARGGPTRIAVPMLLQGIHSMLCDASRLRRLFMSDPRNISTVHTSRLRPAVLAGSPGLPDGWLLLRWASSADDDAPPPK